MKKDWESVLERLEKGNEVRDKLASFDMRSLAEVQRKSSRSPVEVQKVKVYRREEVHDYSSLLPVILVPLLVIFLLVLIGLLFYSVGVEKKIVSSRTGYIGGSVSTTPPRGVAESPAVIYQRANCTAGKLLYPEGSGECNA